MDKNLVSLIAFFIFFTGLMLGIVAPTADKLKAKSKLDKYFRLQNITSEQIESIEYYSIGGFNPGLPSNGAYVVYKNEPEYIYNYDYLMTGDSVYPNITVTKNGREVSYEEYLQLKNKTVSYDEFNKYFVF